MTSRDDAVQTLSAILNGGDLTADEAAQIKDILLTEVTIPSENIRIFEVK